MHRITFLFLLWLAACGKTPDATGLRDPAAPIYSSAALDMARLDGHWVQVAGFAGGDASSCNSGTADFTAMTGQDMAVAGTLCLTGQTVAVSGPVRSVGPGRLQVGADVWWVLWVDTDYRTVVVGTPSGLPAFVLNRTADIPADRRAAVREIYDFNGYDLGRLREF